MLMDEALHFMRLGASLERSDNTARLVDVKFHAIQEDWLALARPREQENDFYLWSAILRSVSGFEIYRKVYRDVIRADRVAELLILRADMPRSLMACMNEVVENLKMISSDDGLESRRSAGKLQAKIQYAKIDEILDAGLHAFLVHFLHRINQIASHVSREFLVAGPLAARRMTA